MVKVRVYVEGGGDRSNQRAQLREGFARFFQNAGYRISVITFGSRNNAYRVFKSALRQHTDSFNVLLVDAESPVTTNDLWQHLQNRDSWEQPASATAEQCQLMVQTMEAWFIADVEALARFYGQGFNRNSIPRRHNVEEIPKHELEPALQEATKRATKGSYAKIRHGARLLGQIDPARVSERAPHCVKLLSALEKR